MHTRHLGPLTVSALGLGCMGMTEFYGDPRRGRSRSRPSTARSSWASRSSTPPTSTARTPTRSSSARRSRAGATRSSWRPSSASCAIRTIRRARHQTADPSTCAARCEASLRRLGVETIDLYYQHRVDPGDADRGDGRRDGRAGRRQGKVRYLGLSEASPATLGARTAVHPIAALQSEYSLWTREPEDEHPRRHAARLGIGFVAYSPLGRGLLAGAHPQGGRPRRGRLPAPQSPRFQGDNFERQPGARRAGARRSPRPRAAARAARARLGAGARQGHRADPGHEADRRYLEENVAALDIELTADEFAPALDAVYAGRIGGRRRSLSAGHDGLPERLNAAGALTRQRRTIYTPDQETCQMVVRRISLAYPASPVAPAPAVDLSDRATRERLSGPGLRAFFNVMARWQVKDDDARLLLGGVTNGPYYEMKRQPDRLLDVDRLTRVSLVIGIFKALGMLYSDALADRWVHLPNSNRLFGGATPLAYMIRGGVPGAADRPPPARRAARRLMRLPPVTAIDARDTHRLVPSRYSPRGESVLVRIADPGDDAHLCGDLRARWRHQRSPAGGARAAAGDRPRRARLRRAARVGDQRRVLPRASARLALRRAGSAARGTPASRLRPRTPRWPSTSRSSSPRSTSTSRVPCRSFHPA